MMSSKEEEKTKPTAQGTNGEDREQQIAQQAVEEKDGEQKGLFDQPLIMEGKRKRKSTEHFAFTTEKRRQSTGKYEGGSGCKLGDIPFVEYQLSQHKVDELKLLHRLCYDRQGTKTEIKKNLRNFTGWEFDENSEQQKKKRTAIEKFSVGVLKRVALLLGLSRSGSKDDLCDVILGFLIKPVDSGKIPPSKKRKTSSSGGKGATKRSKKQKVSDSEEEEEEIEMEEDDDEEEEEEDEEEMDQEADEEEEEESKAKKEDVKEDKKCSPKKPESTTKDVPTKPKKE